MSDVRLQTCHLNCAAVALTNDLSGSIGTAWGIPPGWLIAQTFGGVLWGRAAEGHLSLATTAEITPDRLLQPATLIGLRLFNGDKELRLWRREPDLAACMLSEGSEGESFAAQHEHRYPLHLPANLPAEAQAWFAEPAKRSNPAARGDTPGWLRVRHYLTRDPQSGLLRVAEHRLLGVEP